MTIERNRHETYLSNYRFYSNSIEFRIHSSKALEKWKNVQAFQLNQLVNGKFYFAADRREILLLKYDFWSRWLYEIENICIEMSGTNHSAHISQDDIDLIVSLANKTVQKYRSIITDEHSGNFNSCFTKVWMESQEDISEYFIDKIQNFCGLAYIDFFTRVVDVLIEIMQYTLIAIHELDAMCVIHIKSIQDCRYSDTCSTSCTHALENSESTKDNTPFVIITPFAEKLFKDTSNCLVCGRLNVYRKYFGVGKIYIKNYTNDFICQELIDRIEENGFEIDYKMSVTKNKEIDQ